MWGLSILLKMKNGEMVTHCVIFAPADYLKSLLEVKFTGSFVLLIYVDFGYSSVEGKINKS